MKKIALFFVLSVSVLSASSPQEYDSLDQEDFDFVIPMGGAEKVNNQRENYFLTSTDYKIAPKVNPVTGEYSEEELDLVVAGSQPLSVRRFYNSSSPYEPRYATWRYNPECYCVANLELSEQEIFAAIGEADGSICSMKRSPSDYFTFQFEVPKGFVAQGDGTTHPLNTKITYSRIATRKDKHRFQYLGTIVDGSGRKRSFCTLQHRWTTSVFWREKKKGEESEWRIGANVWTPYQIPITEEVLPNGNIICYTYEEWKKETQNYPYPPLIHSITAYNSDKTEILGTLRFYYPRNKEKEIIGVHVVGSDGRKSVIHYRKNKKSTVMSLVASERPGQPIIYYNSQDQLLWGIEKPEGRKFITVHNNGKVAAQQAPVGPNGEMLPIARYEYNNGITTVYDAENNKINYHYDSNKKITATEIFQGDKVYRIERFTFDPNTGNLIRKTVEDGTCKQILVSEFQYDKNQNPILERVGDGRQWREIKRTYSEDGLNLKLTETDREGKLICYHYVPHTNLLASELVYEGTQLKKRTFHFYDNCAILIKTIVDDGTAQDPDHLTNVTLRKIVEITPKRSLPCFGLPETVQEKTIDPSGHEILLKKIHYTYTAYGKVLKEEHFDANNAFHHCIENTYDDKGATHCRNRRGGCDDPFYV